MVESQPKPDWFPIPRRGTDGVEGRVLLGRAGLFIANLRFSEKATIDKHAAPWDIDVICISGSGYVSVGNEVEAFRAGQSIRWPRNVDHCLWTDSSTMETIMVERHGT